MGVYEDRYIKAKQMMVEKDIDALYLGLTVNMYYMTGFWTFPGERLLAVVIPKDGDPIFIVPRIYEDHVKETTWIKDIRAWPETGDPWKLVKKVIEELKLSKGTIAIDDQLWTRFFVELQKIAPIARFKFASDILKELRRRKSREEIALMRKAGEIADGAMEAAIAECRIGRSEVEIAAVIEYEMRKRGSEGTCFDTIVASGPNSLLPHYTAGERKLREGDVLVLDFGGIYRRYCSDITRTIFIGKPLNGMKKVYEVVREAQERALEFVKCGVEAQEVDRVARRYIRDEGYGKYFFHRTGHGIGLEDHEEPYIIEGNTIKLEPGTAFSIEPGIYIPGKFGIRIEDIVVVTEKGCERMNKYPKELISV